MKTIAEWQKLLKAGADKKFPNNSLGNFDRVASLQEQLDDIKAALDVENGTLISNDHAHQDTNLRIGALVADAFIFAEERGADIESEIEKVLVWFQEHNE